MAFNTDAASQGGFSLSGALVGGEPVYACTMVGFNAKLLY